MQPLALAHDMPETALFVVNQPSGVGSSAATIEQLRRGFETSFQCVPQREVAITATHDEVVERTRAFVLKQAGQQPCFLLAGGGGGTLRAVVQGAMEACAQEGTLPDHILVSALRLGSGNPIPRHFGVPRDPAAALPALATALMSQRASSCQVYRCTFGMADGTERHLYGAMKSGLGQFGRVPAVIAEWRARYARLMRVAVRVVSLEAITTGQYIVSNVREALRCVVNPHRAELVEVRQAGRTSRMRLLAAMLLNFDLPQFPFGSGCRPEEPRMMLCCLPFEGRAQTLGRLVNWRGLQRHLLTYEITPHVPLEVSFLERPSTVAIDEDVFPGASKLTFALAGALRFVH